MKRVALKKAAMKMEFILSVIAASALLLPLSSFGEGPSAFIPFISVDFRSSAKALVC